MKRTTTAQTPAIAVLEDRAVAYAVHSYEHSTDAPSYGLEAAEKLDIEAERIFKTLVVSMDGSELAVCIIPVTQKLSMKKAAACFGSKRAQMAEKQRVLRSTGYILGGVSPIGQKQVLRTALDETAILWETILVSGGKRGLDVELSPDDLIRLCSAEVCDLVH